LLDLLADNGVAFVSAIQISWKATGAVVDVTQAEKC
jgi:hypothetical protein